MRRQRLLPAGALVIAVLIYAVGTASVSHSAAPAAGFTAYATGTNVHVTGLQAPGGPRLANADVAFSAATTGEDFARQNEMQVQLIPATTDPALPADAEIAARGSGLEAALASDVPVPDPTIPLPDPQVAWPGHSPQSADILNTGTDIAPNPLVYASVLRAQAAANAPCGTSSPLAQALGYAADAQLLDASQSPDPNTGELANPVLSTDTPGPDRAVSQSTTTITAFPNGTPGHFGLQAQVRETFAPIFISRGTGLPLDPGVVIEVLGEWVFTLRAPGDAPSTLTYTVEDSTGAQPSPTTPIIRVSSDGGVTFPVANQLTFQDIFDAPGLVVPAAPLLTLAIGEDPRAIADPGDVPDDTTAPTLTNTEASGAVDVIRAHLLQNTPIGTPSAAADLRIGHFEGALTVPTGGFACEVPTTTTEFVPPPTTNGGGTLEICTQTDNSNGQVSGTFTYHFDGRTVTVPANGCSGPLSVDPGRKTVNQVRRNGITMTNCSTKPRDRLVECDPQQSRAIARVPVGGVSNETMLIFTERVTEANPVGAIKVCNIAGNGVAEGTNFNYTVGGRKVTVPAGPANQGGYCKVVQNFNQGDDVTVTEAAASGTHVSKITVQPANRKVSSSNAGRTATVTVGSGNTVVSFTNAS
jgi:hypothetical protein